MIHTIILFPLLQLLLLLLLSNNNNNNKNTFFVVAEASSVYDDSTTTTNNSCCVNTDIILLSSPYTIILDGGSTGTRLHIFEYVVITDGEDYDNSNNNNNNSRIERRGSTRVDRPITDFVNSTSNEISDYLMPLFIYASKQIPNVYHKQTKVQYAATAGMRLLPKNEQNRIYNNMYDGLINDTRFVFTIHDMFTLSGVLEGFYGAIAANYLHGTIQTNLQIQNNNNNNTKPIGSLDMGGSSTQIVYYTTKTKTDDVNENVCNSTNTMNSSDNEECITTTTTTKNNNNHNSNITSIMMNVDDFFSTSYLSYGVDQFRERLWTLLVKEHDELINEATNSQQHNNEEEEVCIDPIMKYNVLNPCSNPGFTAEWQGYTLIGTGDANTCIKYVQRLIPHPTEITNHTKRGMVGGLVHPIDGLHDTDFFAMSVYFYAFDAVRHYTSDMTSTLAIHKQWPKPTLNELYDAVQLYCRMSWSTLQEYDIHHKYTQHDSVQLAHRCYESIYMITLLRDGYGFNPNKRSITYTYQIQDSEVEWTLGMALSIFQQQNDNINQKENSCPAKYYYNDNNDNVKEELLLHNDDNNNESGGTTMDDDDNNNTVEINNKEETTTKEATTTESNSRPNNNVTTNTTTTSTSSSWYSSKNYTLSTWNISVASTWVVQIMTEILISDYSEFVNPYYYSNNGIIGRYSR